MELAHNEQGRYATGQADGQVTRCDTIAASTPFAPTITHSAGSVLGSAIFVLIVVFLAVGRRGTGAQGGRKR